MKKGLSTPREAWYICFCHMVRKVIIIVGILCLVAAVGLFLRSFFMPGTAGLSIQAEPESTVFIDNVRVGTTPFLVQQKPGEVMVKIVPFSKETALVPYETKVTLISGIETVIRRTFGSTDEASAGEILSFEKIGGKRTSVAIVSSPDAVKVDFDGKNSGFTPLRLDSLEPGNHHVHLEAQGYMPREVAVNTIPGYKLTLVVKLAQTEAAQQIQTEQAVAEDKKTFVEILNTPTGFLRVRQEASTASTEVGQVTPGKKYLLIEEDNSKKWFKIEYLPTQAGVAGKTGWVSAQYAKKVEE